MKQTSVERIGRSQLIPSVGRTNMILVHDDDQVPAVPR